MASPSDLLKQTNVVQWTNGRGLITGATLSALFATIIGIFSSIGTWDNTGNFTVRSALSNGCAVWSGGNLGGTGIACATASASVTGIRLGAGAGSTDIAAVPATTPGVGDYMSPQSPISVAQLPNLTVTPSMTTAQINATLAAAAAIPGSIVDFVTGNYSIAKTTTGCQGESVGLMISNSTNLTVDLHGSKLLNTGTDLSSYATTLCLDTNVGLTVRNGTEDYKSLPFTQAVLTSKTATTLVFRYDPLFPPSFTTVQRLESFDPSTLVYTGTIFEYGGGSRPITNNGDGTFTLTVSSSADQTAIAGTTVGNSYLLQSQVYGADAVGLFQNSGVRFDNFRVRAAAGMGFKAYGWNTAQIAQRDFTFQSGSGVELLSGRAQSTNADCIHLDEVRGNIKVTDATVEGCRDDAFNVYGFQTKVFSVTNATSFLAAGGRPWVVGDVLNAIDPNGVVQGQMTVTASAQSGSNQAFSVVSEPSGLAANWILEDVTNAPSFMLTGSRIGQNRGRGILFNGRKAFISSNYFHDIPAASAFWTQMSFPNNNEGIYPQSIDFIGNTLEKVNIPDVLPGSFGSYDCGAIYINVLAADGVTQTVANQIQNINIKGNVIRHTGNSAACLSGIGNTDISGNDISDWGSVNSSTFHSMGTAGLAFWNVANVHVGLNVWSGNLRVLLQPVANGPGSGVTIDQSYNADDAYLSTGQTYTAQLGSTDGYFLGNSSTLANLSLALPPFPSDKQRYIFHPASNVTNLSYASGTGLQSVTGPTSLTANTPVVFRFKSFYNSWFAEAP